MLARLRLAALSLALVLLAACGRSHALGVRPDLDATWDVMHDDIIDVEVRVNAETHRARITGSGGRVAFHDAGAVIELEIDCARPELICPGELLAHELHLDNRTGDISDDGDEFALSFAREGQGACKLLPGSVATASIETRGSTRSGTWIATALTRGNTTTVLPARCFGSDSGLPDGAEVSLSSGFTAARR